MKKDDKNNPQVLAAELQSATRMRKPELKLKTLYLLVEQDYIDNKKKSLSTVLHHINKHLRVSFPDDRSAARVTTADLEEYKTARRAAGASQSTVNAELAALSRGYSLAVKRELLDRAYMPTFNFYSIGMKNRRKGFFERADYERFLAVLPDYLRDAARFMYICGWRPGEVRDLRWDVNYLEAEQVIRIYDSKNGDTRVLPLVDEDGEVNDIGSVIADRMLAKVPGCQYIFHYNGKPLVKSTFYLHWKSAKKALGSDRNPHDFRRTASRNLRNKGVDQTDRMMIIGHRTPSMDIRYGIVNTQDIQRALRKVSLNGKKKIEPSEKQVHEEKPQRPVIQEEVLEAPVLQPYFLNANSQESDSSTVRQEENLAEVAPGCEKTQDQSGELDSGLKRAEGWAGRLLTFFNKWRS